MRKNLWITTAAIFVAAFLFSFYDVFSSFDSILQDKVYQNPRGINNKIKIIAIDDKTLETIGPFGTWSRSVYADMINILGDHPKIIGLDIMIFGQMDEEGDQKLKKACLDSGRVVSGSYVNYSSAYRIGENGKPYINHFNIENIEQPIIEEECETGFVNASSDEDGIVRSIFLTQYEDNKGRLVRHDSLAYKIYREYCKKTGIAENVPKLDGNRRMWIDYAGRPYDYEHISLSNVLDGTIDPKVFTDCIVLVGAYAAGLQDQYSVPDSADLMHGVEIHANIVQALLDGKTPVPANRVLMAFFAALFAETAFFVSARLKFKMATPVILLMTVGYVVAAVGLFSAGFILQLLYAPFFVVMAYLINLIKNYLNETAEKRKLTEAFKKYVAPQVVEEMQKKGGYTIKLGGENRHVAVLFVDIRGFTPLSESLEPEQVVDILNSYLNLTTNAIFANGGTLDKFIGDAAMAVFNAPFDLDDYVYRAVKTAWDIVRGGSSIEYQFQEKYGKSVSFGVGVNCGNAVVGNIGCDFRMDYTAIGDTVNTAARLEANAGRGQVLISEEVYSRVKDRITAEPIGEIPLKGKAKGVFVYALEGLGAGPKDDWDI